MACRSLGFNVVLLCLVISSWLNDFFVAAVSIAAAAAAAAAIVVVMLLEILTNGNVAKAKSMREQQQRRRACSSRQCCRASQQQSGKKYILPARSATRRKAVAAGAGSCAAAQRPFWPSVQSGRVNNSRHRQQQPTFHPFTYMLMLEERGSHMCVKFHIYFLVNTELTKSNHIRQTYKCVTTLMRENKRSPRLSEAERWAQAEAAARQTAAGGQTFLAVVGSVQCCSFYISRMFRQMALAPGKRQEIRQNEGWMRRSN